MLTNSPLPQFSILCSSLASKSTPLFAAVGVGTQRELISNLFYFYQLKISYGSIKVG